MKSALTKQINEAKVRAATATGLEGADIVLQEQLGELTDGISSKVIPPTDAKPRDVRVVVKPCEGMYQGAEYEFILMFGSEYPIVAPKCIYVGPKIFHPNIDEFGGVSMSWINKDQYLKPVLSVSHIVMGLELLFLDPNPDDPLPGLAREAAVMMREDKARFAKTIKEYMKRQDPLCTQ